jgi:hypothetical protein
MRNLHLRHFTLLWLLLLTAHLGWGQGTTTSSMSGTITDQTGAGLPGATVIAVHTPTNTQYVSPTNAQGRFNLQNMRVGGPYTVRISFVGYQDITRSNITLTLGQDYRLDVKLNDASTELANVVVTGTNPRSVLNAERSGAVTNIGTEQLQRLPTVTRSLNDFLRLTPQASPTVGAIGGGNSRQNNITVDGSDFNNNFGIGSNLPANGSPVSLDAIEEITVNLTPFDVRQSGFVGSAVNAVTRSGSNIVSGSIYGFYRNQNYTGKHIGSEDITINNTSVKQFGFRLGGPIIKDKLFFFINAERSTEVNPGQQNVASTAAAPYSPGGGNIARPTAGYLDGVRSYLQSTYQYDPGSYQGYNFQNDNTRILGRLDWNINSKNHFSVRYSQVNSKSPSFPSTSGVVTFPNSRTSLFALPFSNSIYFQESNFYSGAAELNSTIGSHIFNTLRATYTHQNDPRSSPSSVFPFVDILDGSQSPLPNGGYGALSSPFTSFGYELFTAGNLRDVETYSAVDFISGTFGKHTVTVGGQFDLQSTKNGFQRYGTSYYAYNTLDDFQKGANPVAYATTYSLLPDYAQAFPRFKTAQYSLYAQDEFAVSEKFRLTYGLRAELNNYLNVNEVRTNPTVAAQTFTDGRRIDTGVLPTNRVLFSPRVGFNWDIKGDRTLQLRGGLGAFTGKVPTVWLVAQSGDAGMLQVTQTATTYVSGTGRTPQAAYGSLPGFNTTTGVLPFSPDPAAHRPAQSGAAPVIPTGGISATDPNFRNPLSGKASLALDAKLPFGFVGTLEGIYNRDFITAYGQNYNLVNPTALNAPNNYPDHREVYPTTVGDRYTVLTTSTGVPTSNPAGATGVNAIVLSNGHRGYYWSATAKIEKVFSSGLVASLAYSRSDARNIYDGTGDQLINTWSLNQIVNNPNNPALSYASYVVPDRVVGQISYRKEYLRHLATQISMFYSGSSQGRFSYTYSGDFNRDGQTNDLIYIPRNASEITFVSGAVGTQTLTDKQQSDLFFQYIDQDPYLSKHRGEYAERNGAKLPWRNQVDIRLAQDIFVADKTRNTLQFTVDVVNVGNLLNRNWGTFQTPSNSAILTPVTLPTSTTTPTFRLASYGGAPLTSTFRNLLTTTTATPSTYYMQIGLRYSFN